MQQSTEKRHQCSFSKTSITPETQKQGNELKELTVFNFYSHRNPAQRKEEMPHAKSIFEYLKKNETTDISEKQVEEYLYQMINLNLFFDKKTDQGLDSFYKTTEKNEIPLDLSYIT